MAERRSSSVSPRLGSGAGAGSRSADSEVDALMIALSWADPLERKAADSALRAVLGLDASYVLISLRSMPLSRCCGQNRRMKCPRFWLHLGMAR